MTHTVTLLADHKGFTKPKVMGDEYCVDAVIDITSYTANGEEVLATSLGLSSVTAVVITGVSVDTIAAGYSVSVISAEVLSGAANGGQYIQTGNKDRFQINVPAASNTDNVGELRVRVWGNL